ncbi:MAG: META domain-containing protein [Pyrinomonadaceae bacterium]
MKNINRFSAIFIFLLAAIFSFSVKTSAQIKNEILIVADQKASCRGIVAQDCLQVKHLNEENFGLFRQNIENFKFIPGYFYVLEVRVETVRNSSADASNLRYRLRRILARVKSDNFSTSDSSASPAQNAADIEWKLTRLEGKAVDNGKAFIKFDDQNNRVSGSGGCNSFGGTLAQDGNQIKISRIISTKMACVNRDTMQVEYNFFKNLERVTAFHIRSGKLYLSAGDVIIMEFAPKK